MCKTGPLREKATYFKKLSVGLFHLCLLLLTWNTLCVCKPIVCISDVAKTSRQSFLFTTSLFWYHTQRRKKVPLASEAPQSAVRQPFPTWSGCQPRLAALLTSQNSFSWDSTNNTRIFGRLTDICDYILQSKWSLRTQKCNELFI